MGLNRREFLKKSSGGTIFTIIFGTTGILGKIGSWLEGYFGVSIYDPGLTAPNLQRAVAEIIMKRGAQPLISSLPFKEFEGGTSFEFVWDTEGKEIVTTGS